MIGGGVTGSDWHAPPLVVLRSEIESGRVGLRLIGELDLNTVAVLEAALAPTRSEPPPSVIDLSELRFLDLAGLRALLRAVEDDAAGLARLVGATGIVRRLIALAHTIDAPPDATAAAADQATPTTTIGAQWEELLEAHVERVRRLPAGCSPGRDEEQT
jgi:anti-anti-sigma factor